MAASNEVTQFVTDITPFLDSLDASVDGIVGDVQFLKDTITKIDTNPGPISPEDQALLTAALSRLASLDSKAKALDEATEKAPEPPVA